MSGRRYAQYRTGRFARLTRPLRRWWWSFRRRRVPEPVDYVGRPVVVTGERADLGLPPVGAVGTVVGSEEIRPGALTHAIRFSGRAEVWTTLPTEGIDIGPESSD